MSFILPLLVAFLGLQMFQGKKRRKIEFNILLAVTFLLSIFGCLAQIMASSKREAAEAYQKTYNTDTLHEYEDLFDSKISQRISAATALNEYHQKANWNLVTNSTDGLDYMLSFWEDLGYDEQHGKISAEVAWEGFYDDIEAYYQGTAEYIASAQKDDPTYFENIQPLFDDVTKIEAQKRHLLPSQLRMRDKDYLEYLRSEMDLKKIQ